MKFNFRKYPLNSKIENKKTEKDRKQKKSKRIKEATWQM